MGSDYSSLPLGDDLEDLETAINTLIADIADLQTALDAVNSNINSVGNGNPATMYSYAEVWNDATQYQTSGNTYSTLVSSSTDPITVDNMRFLMVKFEGYGTAGGGTGGSQKLRAILDSDGYGSYFTTSLTNPVFVSGATLDLPAAWTTYYGFIPVAELTGDYYVLFQGYTSGGYVDIKNSYVYEQILI